MNSAVDVHGGRTKCNNNGMDCATEFISRERGGRRGGFRHRETGLFAFPFCIAFGFVYFGFPFTFDLGGGVFSKFIIIME